LTLSNLLNAYQVLMQHKVGIHLTPTGPKGSQPGMYLKTSQLLSVSSKTQYVDDSTNFVGFLINDPDGIEAIKVERGIPGSAKARALLLPSLSQTDKDTSNYVDSTSKSGQARPKTILDPAGAGAVEQALIRAAQSVGFGKTSVANGAKTFFADAQKALSQA